MGTNRVCRLVAPDTESAHEDRQSRWARETVLRAANAGTPCYAGPQGETSIRRDFLRTRQRGAPAGFTARASLQRAAERASNG